MRQLTDEVWARALLSEHVQTECQNIETLYQAINRSEAIIDVLKLQLEIAEDLLVKKLEATEMLDNNNDSDSA